jgi:Tfp pilus assembly protein PilF
MRLAWIIFFCVGFFAPALHAQVTNSQAAPMSSEWSRLLEVEGKVEFQLSGRTDWQTAAAGTALKPGDRVRTDAQSRAALLLSDKSIVRLSERTLLEIQPPRRAEKRRFRLPFGSLFFFNRERPSDVEFETPLATGAVRGTEFFLESTEIPSATRLALLDGAVTLQASAETVDLSSGEQVRIAAGQKPVKTALIDAVNVIQWALYYPGVLNPDDLALTDADKTTLQESLQRYAQGDLLGALATSPEPPPNNANQQIYRAALELSVGRVDAALQRLLSAPTDSRLAVALREVIASVAGKPQVAPLLAQPTSTELLARSYALQSQTRLQEALTLARRATQLAPSFGYAHERLAELQFASGYRREALAELSEALRLSPRNAQAHALRGFIYLEQNEPMRAFESFEAALGLDGALGNAWLGRGLAVFRLGNPQEARRSIQTAAALEPQRSLFRSYLGKAFSDRNEPKLAEKDFRLAKQLDPKDPTPWLYSALHLWQENRINQAVRDLEKSLALNNYRAVYRSQLLLDRDRSVRSADLSAIYADAGLQEVSRHVAARSADEDYANFSGHLFLANTYQRLEDPNRFNLRYETPRQSELLLANLLAPPGAGNLSQILDQQEHLRFFEPRPVGFSSLTEYRSNGDWVEAASLFGTVGGLSYALDHVYESQNGQRVNEQFERRTVSLQLKQQVTTSDSAYLQAGYFNSAAGDLAQYYDPSQASAGFHVTERQEPTLYAGWHHEWSPGSHTLLLVSRLPDHLSLLNPQPNVLFFRQSASGLTGVETSPGFSLDFDREFTLYSAELQHIWQTPRHGLVVGGRFQSGSVDSAAILNRVPAQVVTDQQVDTSLQRENAYAYSFWQIADPLRLIAGVSYDRLEFPQNTELPPLQSGQRTRDQVSPKAGLLYAPWAGGLFRASYTRSLGGLFFDNSIRLEPTQIAGFNQAFRSLIPESVAGLVPGSEFETKAVGFDQSFRTGTYFGVESEWLGSDGSRTVGVLTNASFFLPFPDAPSSTRQTLRFRETDVSAYISQLLGNSFSVSARYRLGDAHLEGRFPQVPAGTGGLESIQQNQRALLHQVSLAGNFQHYTGFFGSWESVWYGQRNSGYTPALPGDNFWQHNLFAGYRFPRRYAELRLGLLNITDTDYRLNPLNLYSNLPRHRTLVASLRLNF